MASEPTGQGVTIPITLDGYADGWIEIKARRGWAAASAIESRAMVVRQADAEAAEAEGRSRVSGSVDLVEMGIATLDHAILSWSLDPRPGRAYYLSDDFDEDLGDYLVKTINEFYEAQKRTADARRD